MDFLYHASLYKNLKLIKPQRTLSKDIYIGNYVFATADKKLAAMYLATKGYATYMEPRGVQNLISLYVPTQRNICLMIREGQFILSQPALLRKHPKEGWKIMKLLAN